MGLDMSGVLTVGTLVPKEGANTLLHYTLLVIPLWSRKPPFFVGIRGHINRAVPTHHMVNKAHTCWPAANLISLSRLKLHGQNAPKTASPRHCEKIVLLGGT